VAEHNDKGKAGELVAKLHLERQGYEILQTNWRFERCEVDIIAQQKDILVFVEVKTRRNAIFGLPEESVGLSKQENLAKAATAYLRQENSEAEIRFDIVAIILDKETEEIHHIEDAFFPSV